jgi:hypothetical protein
MPHVAIACLDNIKVIKGERSAPCANPGATNQTQVKKHALNVHPRRLQALLNRHRARHASPVQQLVKKVVSSVTTVFLANMVLETAANLAQRDGNVMEQILQTHVFSVI